MSYVPDNLDAWYEEEHRRTLEEYQQPKCDICEEPIWDGEGIEFDDGTRVHKGNCLHDLLAANYSEEEIDEFFVKYHLEAEEI